MDLESWANEKYPMTDDERSYHRTRTPLLTWKGSRLAKLRKYHRQGFSAKLIARKLNCSVSTVRYAISRYIK